MKKSLALVLAGTMAFGLTACGGGKTSTPSTTAAAAAATEAAAVSEAATEAAKAETADLNVGVFYYTYSDTYIASVRTALDKALGDAGISYQDYDGNSNQTTQNEQIDTAISQGANLLIVNIVTSGSVDASQAIVDKASAAGIPVIFFNRAVESDEDEGKVLGSYDKCAFVGTDAPEAGHMQGKLIGDYLVENFDKVDLNGDGKISYAMFMGQLGNVEAIYRTQYGVEDANAVLKEAGKPELEYFDASNTDCYQVDQDGNWSATAANNYMNTNLAQYSEANGNMIESARIGSNTANTGLNYECDAIAACVIGGVSFVGGTGKISGVVMGVFLLRIIFVALNFLSINANLQYIIKYNDL
jgi:methyl-galactoside transport system substrate-binding protein